jgi:hypothetical protein
LLLLGFIVLMFVGLLYAGVVGSREWVLSSAEAILLLVLFFFWVTILAVAQQHPDGLSRVLHGFFISIFIYLSINIIAVFVGFESGGQLARYTREFDALFNPGGVRTQFPLAQGGQFFAIIAGTAVILSIYKLRGPGRGDRLLGLIGGTLGVLVLMGQSARAPLMALVLVLAYWVVWKRAGRVLTPLLIAFLVAMPMAFVYTDAGGYLNDILALVGLDISRSEGDVASLSNRDVIWSAALNHMFLEAAWTNALHGYGAYGHVASGLSEEYRWLFEHSYADLEHPTLHSSYVQVFVDYGVLGVLLLIGLLFVAGRRLRTMMLRQRHLVTEASVLTMILMYMSVCAVTDVSIGYYAWDLLSVFLFMNIYVMAQRAPLHFSCPADLLRRN